MSKIPLRIPCPEAKAEGVLYLRFHENDYQIPYDTQLVGPEGCSIHFWLGHNGSISGLPLAARKEASNFRDIVTCTYSVGEPIGFWARQDMKP